MPEPLKFILVATAVGLAVTAALEGDSEYAGWFTGVAALGCILLWGENR